MLALTRSGRIGKILRKLSFQDLEQVTGCEGNKLFQAWLRVSMGSLGLGDVVHLCVVGFHSVDEKES